MGCALLCGALLGACSDGDEQIIEEQPRPEVPYLNVYPASFDEAGADGTTFRATVESNRTVEVESSAEWCEAELKADTEQNNLEITVYANTYIITIISNHITDSFYLLRFTQIQPNPSVSYRFRRKI